METCGICPRRCNINRKQSISGYGSLGVCGMGKLPVVARAAKHFWEEPCISGSCGSGTVFFSGCSLKCCFCQNFEISAGGTGKEISIQRLEEIYNDLIAGGAHNINLVNPTHFLEAILESLKSPLRVPVVYNSSGFESVSSLKRLEGKVQIYLPDLKYSDNNCAVRFSKADGYFDTAKEAILEMYRQVGDFMIDAAGIMQRGVLIRHLILPGHLENTFGVIDWIAGQFKRGQVLFSLMCQYVPSGKAGEYPEINRTLTREEAEQAEQYLFESGIEDGFVQELEAASERYIPEFDLQGV